MVARNPIDRILKKFLLELKNNLNNEETKIQIMDNLNNFMKEYDISSFKVTFNYYKSKYAYFYYVINDYNHNLSNFELFNEPFKSLIISDVIMIPKEEQYGGYQLDIIDRELKNFLTNIKNNIYNQEIVFSNMDKLGKFMVKYDINNFIVHITYNDGDKSAFIYQLYAPDNNYSNVLKFFKHYSIKYMAINNVVIVPKEQQGGVPTPSVKKNRNTINILPPLSQLSQLQEGKVFESNLKKLQHTQSPSRQPIHQEFLWQSMLNIPIKLKNNDAITDDIVKLNTYMTNNIINSFDVYVHYKNRLHQQPITSKKFTYIVGDPNNENNLRLFLNPKDYLVGGLDIENVKFNIPLHQEGGAPKRNRKNKGPPILLSPEIRKSDLDNLMSNTPVVSNKELDEFYKNTKGGRKNKKSRKGKKTKGKKRKTRKN
jgi:hypothetical protein